MIAPYLTRVNVYVDVLRDYLCELREEASEDVYLLRRIGTSEQEKDITRLLDIWSAAEQGMDDLHKLQRALQRLSPPRED